ncbi:MAG: SPOR domain-containing protein [Naasia sp.]
MADKWWYNSRTNEVEQGPQSLGVDRLGPFDTREDAQRAPEKLQENARRWAAEDAAADED